MALFGRVPVAILNREECMLYLVTGGAGFIGSNLVRRLLADGHQVRVLDDLSTGKLANLAPVSDQLTFIEGDVAEEATANAAVAGVDGVFHQAALAAVPRSLVNPIGTYRVNTTGTLNILEACRAAGGPRVVYAASSSAYGNLEVDRKREDLLPDPCSPYAAQKLAGEIFCKVYTETMGVSAIALRYFNVFGPGQSPDSAYAAVIPAFIARMRVGSSPVIFGDGLQSRDFTFVEDVVSANIAAMNAPDEACGQTYNVACGQRITLIDLVERLNTILGTDLAPEFQPERAGDVRHSMADIGRIAENLAWSPVVSLEAGLRQTVAWHLQTLE